MWSWHRSFAVKAFLQSQKCFDFSCWMGTRRASEISQPWLTLIDYSCLKICSEGFQVSFAPIQQDCWATLTYEVGRESTEDKCIIERCFGYLLLPWLSISESLSTQKTEIDRLHQIISNYSAHKTGKQQHWCQETAKYKDHCTPCCNCMRTPGIVLNCSLCCAALCCLWHIPSGRGRCSIFSDPFNMAPWSLDEFVAPADQTTYGSRCRCQIQGIWPTPLADYWPPQYPVHPWREGRRFDCVVHLQQMWVWRYVRCAPAVWIVMKRWSWYVIACHI